MRSCTMFLLVVLSLSLHEVTATPPPPAELEMFRGRLYYFSAFIEWQVTEDDSLASFILERSVDGGPFEVLVEVPAVHSPGSETEYYSIRDRGVPTGKLEYRLTLVYLDGSQEMSAKNVCLNAVPIPPIITHPNPASQKAAFQIPDGGFMEILSLSGQTMYSGRGGQYEVDVSQWPAGMYITRVWLGEDIVTRTFHVQ